MANNIGGGMQNRGCLYSAARKTQEFLFLSLQHQNNRFENVAIFYLTFFHSIAKKHSYEEKILEVYLPRPPSHPPQVTPMTLDVL